jgi:hypothetical protein
LLEGITFILDVHGFELHKKVTSPSLSESVTRSTIPIVNGGCISIATDCYATSTTFSTIVAIIVATTIVSILLAMVFRYIIVIVIIRFFICSVVTMLSEANRCIIIDMHVPNGSHGRLAINVVCYSGIDLIPIKRAFLMHISKI